MARKFATTTAAPASVAGLVLALVLGMSVCVPALSQPSVTPLPKGDPSRGKALYQGCESCHSIDENDVGPKHRGVVGRKAGSIKDYAYSGALKNSGITWDEASLDRWLINPTAMVPGTKMFFKIDDAQSRADLIAYLKQQK